MKKKNYENLIEKVAELKDNVGSLRMYIGDNLDAARKYGDKLTDMEQKLEEGKDIIDRVLTIDMEQFINLFMKHLNDDNYEVVSIDFEENKLYVAKPKNIELSSSEVLFEDSKVYILGINDKKLLSRPAVSVNNKLIPVISLLDDNLQKIYSQEISRHNKKYLSFQEFVGALATSLVEKSKEKKTILTGSKR